MKVRPYYTLADMKKERADSVKDTIAYMLHMFAWYLRDEQNFGHDRLQKALDWLDNHASQYMTEDGEVSLTDVHNMLKQECNVDITFNKERMH